VREDINLLVSQDMKMRAVWGLLVVIGTVSGIAFLFLGVGLYLTTQSPRIEAQMTSIIPTRAHAQMFDVEMETFEQAVQKAEVDELVSITVTQEEVTSKLDEVIKRVDLPVEVRSVVVNFMEGKILVLGKVYVNLEVNVGVVARIEIDSEGKPSVVVEEIDIGRGALLPPGIVDQLTSYIPNMDTVAEYLKELPVKLEEVVIEEGRLTVTGAITSPDLDVTDIEENLEVTDIGEEVVE